MSAVAALFMVSDIGGSFDWFRGRQAGAEEERGDLGAPSHARLRGADLGV